MDRRIDGIDNGAPGRKSSEQSSFVLIAVDADGILESVVTQTSAVTYSGALLDGALMDGSTGEIDGTDARNITVALDSSVGAFVALGEIVITGRHPYYTHPVTGNLALQTETLIIPDADGNVTLTGAKMFAPGEFLSITFPAMDDTDGAFTVGAGVAREVTPPARWLWCNASGTLYVRLVDASDGVIDKLVVLQGPVPFAIDALHASTDITDLKAVVK